VELALRGCDRLGHVLQRVDWCMGWPFVREPDECNVWAGFFVRRVLWLVFWADHALARETAIGGLKAEGRNSRFRSCLPWHESFR